MPITRRGPRTSIKQVLALLLAVGPFAASYTEPQKFLLVSQAASGAILCGRLSRDGLSAKMSTLVKESDGLQHPQGLAIDQRRRVLFVADSGLRKILSYDLRLEGKTLSVGKSVPVVENVEARWVALDTRGNLFYSDELGNTILQVDAQDVDGGKTAVGRVVLDQTAVSSVSAPGGLASDNYFVYWTNKLNGNQVGSVVKALPSTDPGVADPQTRLLTQNTPKAYGLCIATNQVFYTDSEKRVWGVDKAGGGEPVLISSNFTSPRGCKWDGNGLIYVADRSGNGVFAFPAPMVSLTQASSVTKVAEAEDAFGVAVFSRALHLSARFSTVAAIVFAYGLAEVMRTS